MTRRDLLSSLPLAATAASAAAPDPAVRLGGPVFVKTDDPRELARASRALGYSAAYCPKASLADKDRIRAIEDAYKAENVAIAEVGVWVNLLDADAAKRKENLQKVTEGLALADAVGARCCVDIAGSFNEKVWFGPHPKNFSKEFMDAVAENARKIIDAVKPKRAKFAYEMMGWAIPDGPDSYLALMKAVGRKEFGVHIDICNGICTPKLYYDNAAFTRECFAKLGPHIVSCHAKDLEWVIEMNVHFLEVIPGRGKIDYRPYLTELAKLPQQPPLMLEHLKTAEEYLEGATHIRKIANEAGVKFL